MAINTQQVALSTSAAAIFDGASGAGFVKVRNLDALIDIAVGSDSGVLFADGYVIPAGEAETFNSRFFDNSSKLYAVADSGTPSVSVAWDEKELTEYK